MNTQSATKPTDTTIPASMIAEWRRLLIALKDEIGDEYRCTDDPDADKPGMLVTIGFTPADADADKPACWSYQTGDNSYTGGAYGHPHWAIVYLYRRSNCTELAESAADEIADLMAY